MATRRTVVAFSVSALLAAALLLQFGCSAQPQSRSPEASGSATQGATDTSTGPSLPSGQRFWNASTIQQAEQITGYNIYSPAYIPAGFKVDKTIMVNTVGTGPNSFRVVIRRWAWTGDPTVSFTLTQSPKDLGPGNAQPAEVAGTTGERAEQTANGNTSVELGWTKGDAYFVLSGVLKSPLTEDVLDKIAGSIE